MTKIIGILLLLLILRMAVKSFSAQLKAAVFGPPPALPKTPPPPRAVAVETLVPCAACGTYVVASRGFRKGDEVFCSEECRTSAK